MIVLVQKELCRAVPDVADHLSPLGAVTLETPTHQEEQ